MRPDKWLPPVLGRSPASAHHSQSQSRGVSDLRPQPLCSPPPEGAGAGSGDSWGGALWPTWGVGSAGGWNRPHPAPDLGPVWAEPRSLGAGGIGEGGALRGGFQGRRDPSSAFFIGSHSRASGSAKLTLPATSRVMLEPCVFRFAGFPPSLALDSCGVTVWALPVLARVALGDVHSFSIPPL